MENNVPLIDDFGMTPLHVLFSTPEPSHGLLQVLIDKYPYHVLECQDANGKRPLDYLLSNWTETNSSLLEISLQKWMVRPLVCGGATSWTEAMQHKVQAILAEDNKEQRASLYSGAYSVLEKYKSMESTSILEMTLWKRQLKDGWSNDSTKRQTLEREECRRFCGSNAAIPSVVKFLGIY
ncbi:unnamed protein product [Cylindrotheca closterium]|uniref:Uncharacterized protein n=1 Tax=Cylindrotheca closterium TaxID=2856 RepID=A0AAD2JH71_9STRA|nr:unnamed protein product [Cylindrotheca closterium]